VSVRSRVVIISPLPSGRVACRSAPEPCPGSFLVDKHGQVVHPAGFVTAVSNWTVGETFLVGTVSASTSSRSAPGWPRSCSTPGVSGGFTVDSVANGAGDWPLVSLAQCSYPWGWRRGRSPAQTESDGLATSYSRRLR
jgi:hypothetical protein